jgi:cholesterol transport system auxiliary component
VTPIFIRRAAVAALGLALTFALAACVSLFPKEPPAVLYRFEPQLPEASADAASVRRTPVLMAAVDFNQAASGDRLLTVDGDQAAYIEGARWVSSAQALFEESLARAFARESMSTRLVERRQAASARMVLNVAVENFEARYVAGPKAAPTVVVALRAQIIRFPDRSVVAARTFRAEQPAGDNRVSAIVTAFNGAMTSVMKDLTAWTDQAVAGG